MVCANTEVLIIGLIAVVVCATVRTVYEGNGWVKRMVLPDYFLSGVIR
jgi:hypothetical protein